jgi:hypothetical protein
MRWAGHVACMEEMRNGYKLWSENVKGIALRIPRHRWEDNIIIDLKEDW